MLQHLIIASVLIFGLQANAKVLAKVGNKTITESEFKKSYAQAIVNSKFSTRPPTKKEHLEDLIRYHAGLQEAARINLKNNPIVKKALELELYKGLLETQLGKKVEKIKVSEKEMQQYYQNNPNYRSSHILIAYPINGTSTQIEEAKKRALKIYKDVMSGTKKWETYVRMYSDDLQNKTYGGDMGYHGAKSIHPRYYKALKKLQMGQISTPVQGVYGFHIIKKTGTQSYKMANKNAIKIAVFDTKRFKIFDRYFEKLKKRTKVSVAK